MRYQLLLKQAKGGQQVHHALLGAETLADVTWHKLSNSNESGLLSSDSLSTLWPNLQSEGLHIQPQTTLDALLPALTAPRNWLVVDCLPATRILQGAGQQLAYTAVVVARVLTQSQPLLVGQGASMQELCDYLLPQGFILLAQKEELHPAYSTLLLVRDYVSLHQQEQQKSELQVQAYQELKAQLIDAQKTIQTETQAKEALQSELQTKQQVSDRQQQLKDEVGKAEAQLELLKELFLSDGVNPALGRTSE